MTSGRTERGKVREREHHALGLEQALDIRRRALEHRERRHEAQAPEREAQRELGRPHEELQTHT